MGMMRSATGEDVRIRNTKRKGRRRKGKGKRS
jgi:hypothetical protein